MNSEIWMAAVNRASQRRDLSMNEPPLAISASRRALSAGTSPLRAFHLDREAISMVISGYLPYMSFVRSASSTGAGVDAHGAWHQVVAAGGLEPPTQRL